MACSSDVMLPTVCQKLEGRWSLQGKTERSDASGSLEMGSSEGPILQFGQTKLYLSRNPTNCEHSYNQTRYSFEVSASCIHQLIKLSSRHDRSGVGRRQLLPGNL